MQRFKILVPVCFGPQSDVALKQAGKIAREVNGMISSLYVIEKPGFITGMLITREIEQKIRRRAEMELSSTVNRIYGGGDIPSFELVITSGKVHRKILEKSSELGAGLIIMGRSNETDLTKHSIGSNANQVLARSAIPVLITRSSRSSSFRHLFLPLDLSHPVGIKIAKAIEMAELFRARVTVCSILAPGWPKIEEAYRERLSEIKKLFGEYDIPCSSRLVVTNDRVADVILSAAADSKAEQIMLMTQNEPEFTDMFIGTTAREVLKRSELPVLCITPAVITRSYPFKSLFGRINYPIDLIEHDYPTIHN